MHMFIKYIGFIVVLHLNKVQEKLFNFKTKKVQEINEIPAKRNCKVVFIKTYKSILISSQKK